MNTDSLYAKINDFSLSADERLKALEEWVTNGGEKTFPPLKSEINNHIHTIYSFSPYTPSMSALRARQAGLQTAGSVDHDSLSAAEEMQKACKIVKLGCVTGFEVRVSFKKTAFADKKINNPDSEGIVYMTIQGVPKQAREKVAAFLKPLQEARLMRSRKMVESLNETLTSLGFENLNFDTDILPLSKNCEGGGLTERHILYALSLSCIKKFGKGKTLVDALKQNMKLDISSKIEDVLLDETNIHYEYDLLGVFKSSFLPQFFIQPNEDEAIDVELVTKFAQEIGAVPAYAYLGDIEESATGDKKAEKFEDSFLDELFPALKKLGYLAITYMPPRNTREQLLRLQNLCKKYDFMEISGVDINSSRQSFNCPELALPEFTHLIDTTWALVAHEKLASLDTRYGLFSHNNPKANLALQKRIDLYSEIGSHLAPIGKLSKEEAILKCEM